MSVASAPAPPAAPAGMSSQDLLLPMVPSVITSLGLEAISDLSGTAKIGIGAGLALGLWWFTSGRKRPASVPAGTAADPGGAARPAGAPPGFVRSNWKWLLVVVVLLAVIALLVTRVIFERPTLLTAAIALGALAVTTTLAYRGRRAPGAATASIAGGLLGLCLGIAVLSAGA